MPHAIADLEGCSCGVRDWTLLGHYPSQDEARAALWPMRRKGTDPRTAGDLVSPEAGMQSMTEFRLRDLPGLEFGSDSSGSPPATTAASRPAKAQVWVAARPLRRSPVSARLT